MYHIHIWYKQGTLRNYFVHNKYKTMTTTESESKISEAKAVIRKAVEGARERLRVASNEIWTNPELMMEEVKAHAILTHFLEKEGLLVEKSFVLETAFRATFSTPSSQNDPTAMNACVICEYDALPGIGHACGHNLIAESGLAAAIGIKAVMESNPDLKLKLTVMGTPAEEGGGGKIHLIRAGAFKNVDFAMMVHPFPFNAIFPNIMSVERWKINYKGKAAHAAAFPWEGVNALDAAVNAYTAVAHMRQHFRPSWRVHGIITDGGVKANIIPESSQLSYMMRAPNNKQLEELKGKMKGCFEAAAQATGCTVEIDTSGDISYSNMKTNCIMSELYRNNAEDLGIKHQDRNADKETSSFSTDMGDVSYQVPSIHPTYAINTEFPNHSHGFTAAANTAESHESTLKAATSMAYTVIDIVYTKGVLERMRQEFRDAEYTA